MRIAIEGPDGTGKTTQCNLLRSKDYNVYKSPNYESDIGKLIKSRLFSEVGRYDRNVMALLFLADLLEIDKIITNKENSRTISILDRSFYSTLVYQNIDYHIPFQLGFTQPDPVIYLYCDENLDRIKGKKDIFENEEFQEKIKKNYKKVFEYFKPKVHYVDTGRPIQECHENIVNIIKRYQDK